MRPLIVALLPLVTLAAPTHKPVIAVLPARVSAPETARLGLLIDARASALLLNSNQYTVLDMKQVLAMASQEGLDPAQLSSDATADSARTLLGADLVIAVTLSKDATGLKADGSVRDGRQVRPFTTRLPSGWSGALTVASDAMAGAVLEGALPTQTSAQPESKSDAALTALGACWETALRQPVGVDAPVGLSGGELDQALSACRAALKADPSLRFATMSLALLLAIAREDADAEKLLGAAGETDPALTPWVLARFWLLTRHKSTDAAVTFLTAMRAKQSGALLLRSLEAGALASMNEHARAVTTWNEYLTLAPSSAFAFGRLSRSLARLEKHDLALAAAKKGLAVAPASREARLALAARQLDAAKLDDARDTLQPLVSTPNAPAEPLLHLALAYLAAQDLKAATRLFQQAAERATGPRAWRTKGRALYNLALLEAKQGHRDAAKSLLERSRETGFTSTPIDPALADLTTTNAAPTPAGALYIAVAPFETQLEPTVTQLGDTVLHDRLSTFGASIAPTSEEKDTARALIKSHGLRGYELRVKLVTVADTGLKVDMLVMTYPEQALKGSWSVKASGKKQESLVKAMVARVLDDAAGDLEWKN